MKKFRYIIATVFVVAIGAGIFWACQKENEENEEVVVNKNISEKIQKTCDIGEEFIVCQVYKERSKSGKWPDQTCSGTSGNCWLWLQMGESDTAARFEAYIGFRIHKSVSQPNKIVLVINTEACQQEVLNELINYENNTMTLVSTIEDDPSFISFLGAPVTSVVIEGGDYPITFDQNLIMVYIDVTD